MALTLTRVLRGSAISWASVRIPIFGILDEGVLGISYKRTQQMENEYGQGTEPFQRSYGRREYEASITVTFELLKSIIAASPNGDPSKIPPFSIPIVFVDAQTEIPTGYVDTLTSVQIPGDGFESRVGDMRTEIELPLIIGGIKR
jgi:hypothetical protein